jgi:hypothetical protein
MSYTLGGIDLETEYGIKISEVVGNFDMPKRKRPTEHEFQNEWGAKAFTDEEDITWEPRDIILVCFMKADTKAEFLDRLSKLYYDLLIGGMKTLELEHSINSHQVYFREGAPVTKVTRWNENTSVGKFRIPLREPIPAHPAIWRGLAGHWSLEQADEDGGQQTDLSGNGNDADLNNTAYTTDREGTSNSAIEFNGSDAYVDTNTGHESTFRDNFTISLWVKPDDGNPSAVQYFWGIVGAGNHLIQCYLHTGGYVHAYYGLGTLYQGRTTSACFSNGAEDWHHLVLVYDFDRDQMYCYLDGVHMPFNSTHTGSLEGADPSTLDLDSYKFYIGCRSSANTPQLFFDGDMHDPKIYNRALSAEEVKVLYHTYNDSLDI